MRKRQLPKPVNTIMHLEEIIRTSLLPRLLHVAENKREEERQRLMANFQAHVRVLSDFMQRTFMEGSLSVGAFVDLHSLLFPPGYRIKAVGNDGVHVEMRPGEWRKQVLHPHIRVFSPVESIESDLEKIIVAFNHISQPSREDVLRFFFWFMTVHPFGDANGTVAALVCDVLCFLCGFVPLWLLNIRFKDKSTLFCLIAEYEENKGCQSLTNILRKVDAFQQSFPLQRLQ